MFYIQVHDCLCNALTGDIKWGGGPDLASGPRVLTRVLQTEDSSFAHYNFKVVFVSDRILNQIICCSFCSVHSLVLQSCLTWVWRSEWSWWGTHSFPPSALSPLWEWSPSCRQHTESMPASGPPLPAETERFSITLHQQESGRAVSGLLPATWCKHQWEQETMQQKINIMKHHVTFGEKFDKCLPFLWKPKKSKPADHHANC